MRIERNGRIWSEERVGKGEGKGERAFKKSLRELKEHGRIRREKWFPVSLEALSFNHSLSLSFMVSWRKRLEEGSKAAVWRGKAVV